MADSVRLEALANLVRAFDEDRCTEIFSDGQCTLQVGHDEDFFGATHVMPDGGHAKRFPRRD